MVKAGARNTTVMTIVARRRVAKIGTARDRVSAAAVQVTVLADNKDTATVQAAHKADMERRASMDRRAPVRPATARRAARAPRVRAATARSPAAMARSRVAMEGHRAAMAPKAGTARKVAKVRKVAMAKA